MQASCGGGCGAVWRVEQQTLRRDTAKEASTDGIGCAGWIQMLRGCAANPPCYNAVAGSLVSTECLHIDSGEAGLMFRMCVAAKVVDGGRLHGHSGRVQGLQ